MLHLQRWIGLHHIILGGSRDAVFIWAMVNHRDLAAKVVMRRRRRNGPLQRRGFPRIVGGLFSLEQTPEEIDQKDDLGRGGDDGRDGNENVIGLSARQILKFSSLRISARMAHDPHDVHRHEDRIDPDESQPEVKLAQASFIMRPNILGNQ